MNPSQQKYFLPQPSKWPLIGSFGLFFLALSLVYFVHHSLMAPYLLFIGALLMAFTLCGWFMTVIDESEQGLHNLQMDRTYRWGMAWFIVSEIAFFAVFFGVLFYMRTFAVPILGGLLPSHETHQLLWPQFKAIWPLLTNPNPTVFPGPKEVIPALGIPALNTLILLSSALTVTVAHWGLKKNNRVILNCFLITTIIFGILFLSLQAYEYHESYTQLKLTLASGIYGTTFFMLTGFHAAHVTVGLMMLIVILIRCMKGHFIPTHHFAFEAVSWYWHFVDVVWLFLFIFVYWL